MSDGITKYQFQHLAQQLGFHKMTLIEKWIKNITFCPIFVWFWALKAVFVLHPIGPYFYYFSNLNNLNFLGQTPWICNMINWLSNTKESRLMDVYICDNYRLLLNDCVTNNKPPAGNMGDVYFGICDILRSYITHHSHITTAVFYP